ncbi:uncharacterized protein LOC114334450 [Diabrotica virgifera virgifera]|uniref:Uncharacterized protein LOC114334450 n=1 Tax=Diabrotica virgifera virgifera TaxID=50390 RepID=A0A6P7FZS4_DIAVI|nr:uncharacterized protein LOC114334450 [Diabrotica virgifera virgifera]
MKYGVLVFVGLLFIVGIARCQLLGMQQQQREMNRMNQMGGGLGLNLGLGLNNGMYSRSSQMTRERATMLQRKKRAIDMLKPKNCFLVIQVQGTTAAPTSAASIDPRGDNATTAAPA